MATSGSMVRRVTAVAVGAVLLVACAGGDDSSSAPSGDPSTSSPIEASTTVPHSTPPSATTTSTVATTTTSSTTTLPAPTRPTAEDLVRALADDSLDGRNNQTAGGAAARQLIIDELSTFADPLPGLDGFEQPFAEGTNVLAMISGTDLADEYVVVGAHYDHLGSCRNATVDDQVCNGAADNASGVAAALVVARTIAATGTRRSVVIALWDAEEDGLLGSTHYVARPVVPLTSTVAYVNFDLIGSNLLPSLANLTLAMGAETGGTELVEAFASATSVASLDVAELSLLFGQGRSDHAPFVAVGVPIVFFGDATNGCYHSVDDEADRVDFGKLEQQIDIGTALVADLATTDAPPVFDSSAPLVAFDDAVTVRDLLVAARPDFSVLDQAAVDGQASLDEVERIVADGAGEFGDDDAGVLLGEAAALIEALGGTPCL